MAKPASDSKAALNRCALFKNAPAAALAQIADKAKTLNVRRGERVFTAGERCAGVYIVASGRLMLSVGTTPAAMKVIELVSTGGHCGLAATLLDSPHHMCAEALCDSVILLVPRAVLIETAAAHPACGLQLAVSLSRGIASLTDDIHSYSLHSGRQRVANYLMHIAAANVTRGRPFPLPAKKSIIASRLGLTPEYFSRMLHELIVARAIAVEGRQITILDAEALRAAGETAAAAA